MVQFLRNRRLGIVADDLTGAMDTAGVFASHNIEAYMALTPDSELPILQNGVICYNTQSRFMTESEAADSVTYSAQKLVDSGCARIYKKIDSTLRGHVGAEIKAVLKTQGAKYAFVCPAFPAMGRTVEGGVVCLEGQPVANAHEGRNLFSDTFSLSIPELLEEKACLSAGLIDASSFDNEASLVKAISTLMAEDRRVVVFDATTDEHLARIVVAASHWGEEAVLVGSAGMADAFAAYLESIWEGNGGMFRPVINNYPCVLISGSLNNIAQRQLNTLGSLQNLERIPVSASELLTSQSAMKLEAERTISIARAAIEAGKDAAIYWGDPNTLESLISGPENSDWIAERIGAALNTIISGIVDESVISGLILVGGETAYAVLRGLNTEGIRLSHQVLEGVPSGAIIGGVAHGKFVITKAGGFGTETTLLETFEYIRRLRVG